jgi:tRNA modification GTPase
MQTSDNDTIVAIATASGRGAIGIVRLSGPKAVVLADSVFVGFTRLREALPRTLIFGRFVSKGQDLDEILASVMYAPHSYTGEDTVELNCHGGAFLLRKVVDALLEAGARMAGPGEFTKRAFLNGKLDLSQAQAVADMISAGSDLSLQSAYFQLRGGLKGVFLTMADELRHVAMLLEVGLDFSEDVQVGSDQIARELATTYDHLVSLVDSYRLGRIVREGAVIALIGLPNVGKSCLMNQLLRFDRSIVSELPGTTRDTVEESFDLGGVVCRLVDTAGIRETDDVIEREGARRSRLVLDSADLVMCVIDGSSHPSSEEDALVSSLKGRPVLFVLNKGDLVFLPRRDALFSGSRLRVSALTGAGLGELRSVLLSMVLGVGGAPSEMVTQEWQYRALCASKTSLIDAIANLRNGQPGEIIAMDVRACLDSLSEIIGETSSEDLLDSIFRNFCIGK